jgi:hypothetical protein
MRALLESNAARLRFRGRGRRKTSLVYTLVMAADTEHVETDARFPSGEWSGFFLQPSVSRGRWRMDLRLTFKEGLLRGDGIDGVGEFLIQGRYDLKTGEVTFHKRYLRRHEVFYRGWNEGKGIWGTWELMAAGGRDKGGFHIWPKGHGGMIGEELVAEVEEGAGQEERVLVTEEAGADG